MEIELSAHTLARAQERGATEEEIYDVVRTGHPIPARGTRQARAKIYPFGREHLGKHYDQKRVEVIYIPEENRIVTVTVYVFYGTWETQA